MLVFFFFFLSQNFKLGSQGFEETWFAQLSAAGCGVAELECGDLGGMGRFSPGTRLATCQNVQS